MGNTPWIIKIVLIIAYPLAMVVALGMWIYTVVARLVYYLIGRNLDYFVGKAGVGGVRNVARGQIVRIKANAEGAERVTKESIALVLGGDSRRLIDRGPSLPCGVICKMGGLSSHAALLGSELGIPMLFGFSEVQLSGLTDGIEVEINALNKTVRIIRKG
ncbi:MAG TPA: PEP-utilizing enzyme [Candidatus Paceibacterota bacterium]